jgi:hypothetical protein
MFFKRNESFFLDLSKDADKTDGAGKAAPTPVQLAVRETAKPAAAATPATPGTKAVAPAAKPVAPAATPPATKADSPAATSGKPMLTTAEAIAAELRAAQEARPAPSSATFAPDCLNPANAITSRRRTAGANLAGFKAMASEMFKN